MNDDVYRHVGGVREPDPTLGKSYGEHEPATVERVPPVPVEPPQPDTPAKPPKRQRVVLADPRSRSTTLRARVELEEQTSWGTLLIDDLVKHQLRAGLLLAALVLVVLGGLPLAFYFSPDFAGLRVVGLPLAWLLLAVLPFPLLLLAGLVYNRLAERHERDFVDMIEN
ncbi:hypothetical protein [Amycolatopsis sp. GM8]|uniref:hypothetical protein n=1 Tax=Amycolatopsis sp. GM8 TaxID=2896530 RepID=UPI001F272A0E|nr:hypothetical protein [Amycolatopsis sp. GM8]